MKLKNTFKSVLKKLCFRKNTLDKPSLRHLLYISEEKIDYPGIMQDVFGYKNTWLNKRIKFKKVFKKAFLFMGELTSVNPSEIKYNEDCSIIKPSSTDYISFRAMLEIQSLLNNPTGDHIANIMAKTISIVCYQENVEGKYDSKSAKFIEFKEKVLDQEAKSMIGLYNNIVDSIESSSLEWNKRFLSVELEDKDYELAGGSRLRQFNVINTIKSICRDFNLAYDDAWQMSYSLVQTNSYERATANHVQDQMRQIKEIRMQQQRQGNY